MMDRESEEHAAADDDADDGLVEVNNRGLSDDLKRQQKEQMKARDTELKNKQASQKRAAQEHELAKKLTAKIGNKNESVVALAGKWADWQKGDRKDGK
jgi:hypothetical protein